MSKNIVLIILIWLMPFSYSKTVEFGLKLKVYGGYQDDLVFGLINLQSYRDSIKLRELVEECLKDYLTNELMSGVIDSNRLEGKVGKVQLPDKENDPIKIGLTGDVYYFHGYLMTMIHSYYLETSVIIQFYDLPTVKTFRKRPAKLGELVLLDVESAFTGFDTDPLYNFFIKRGEARSSFEASETDEGIEEPFLPRVKLSFEENDKEMDSHEFNCCKIS